MAPPGRAVEREIPAEHREPPLAFACGLPRGDPPKTQGGEVSTFICETEYGSTEYTSNVLG